jgi:hypothetical protein
VAYNVSTSDIEARWRPLSDAEQEIAAVLIDDAIILIDTRRPALAAAVASGAVAERVVVMTVVEAVKRILANPDLLSNQSVTADGGISQGWQFQQKTSAPRMSLSLLDFQAIDYAMGAAQLGTGVTGSIRMMNTTSWSRRKAYGYRLQPVETDDEVASDLMPPTTSDYAVVKKG